MPNKVKRLPNLLPVVVVGVRDVSADSRNNAMVPLLGGIASEELIAQDRLATLAESGLLQSKNADTSISKLLEDDVLASGSRASNLAVKL